MYEREFKKYPLTNDVIFKAVYGREDEACKRALCAMLNLILDKNADPIVSVEIKNPMNNPSVIDGKVSILDIKCKTDTGEIMGVEMQVKRRPDFENRTIYYQGKKIADSLKKSEDYASIRKVVTICIMVESLFDDVIKFHSIYRYKDIETGRELSNTSEMHFIELSKIDATKYVEDMSELERYGLYLLYANDEEHLQLVDAIKSFGDEVVIMTEPVLNYVTSEELIRAAAEDREMFLWEQEVDKIYREREKAESEQVRAEYKQAEAELRQTETELKQAEAALQRAEAERKQAESELQQAESELQQAEAQLTHEKAEREREQSQRNRAEVELQKFQNALTDKQLKLAKNLKEKGFTGDEIKELLES